MNGVDSERRLLNKRERNWRQIEIQSRSNCRSDFCICHGASRPSTGSSINANTYANDAKARGNLPGTGSGVLRHPDHDLADVLVGLEPGAGGGDFVEREGAVDDWPKAAVI